MSLKHFISLDLFFSSKYSGVYKNDGPFEVYVDVSRIGELYQVTKSTPLTIGGGTTLTHLMELFEKIGAENPDYWYTPILAEHIGKIGSTPVRNVSNQYLIILNFEFKYIIFTSFFSTVGKYCRKFDVETRAH